MIERNTPMMDWKKEYKMATNNRATNNRAEYDYAKAKRYIQMHSDLIESAYLGMEEDWFWTAETVYTNGRFTVDLEEDDLRIAGIKGSYWATPTLEVHFKDGRVECKPCFIGDVGGEAPEWFSLGVLSQEVKDVRSCKFLSDPTLQNE